MVVDAGDSPLLVLRGVSKRFGGVHALRDVDFDVRRGEIHALVGENGAGKSTLIKILGGIHAPDAGTIEFDGTAAPIRGVADADRRGIRLIHQELSLAPNLSVAENIYLGREPSHWGLIDRRRIVRTAQQLIERLGLHEIGDVRAEVGRLSVAQRQLVEIARALSSQARILVLDEPTSALSEAETEGLFATLQRLRSQGVGLIYISHRLDEVRRLADRITVLRDGRSMGTQCAADLDPQQLVRWMVGRELGDHFRRPDSQPGEVALEVRGLSNDRVHDVSFQLRYGEILGVAGLVGSGRSELVRAIFGIDRVARGQLSLDGRPLSIRRPHDAIQAGIVLVPEDRQLQGLVMSQSMAFNTLLPWVRLWMRGCWPDTARRAAIVSQIMREFAIKVADPESPVDRLSGGNQQKVLVGRWMVQPPKVLILDEPTRGVDVAAREEMFAIVGRQVASGMAVLLISSDLEEVFRLSHRIAVYRDGRIQRIDPAGDCTLEDVMALLTGANHE